MSSFRPGPAKLYASPEEVKVVAIRQGSSTLGRTPKEGAKSRSHSLPPSGARPQVNIPVFFLTTALSFDRSLSFQYYMFLIGLIFLCSINQNLESFAQVFVINIQMQKN